jgi:ABC-type multidrug transport system fused ATPase/permease subunit
MKKILYSLCLICLLGYAFFADFLMAVLGFTSAKLICALGGVLLAVIICIVQFNKLQHKQYLFVPFILLLLYVAVFHSTSSLSYFYTAIMAFFFIQDDDMAKKFFDVLFVIQFVLVLYEVLTHDLIYTNVVTGLFNTREIELKTDIFDESGFRTKGLFTGCLEATSFAINYSLIFRNNCKKSFWAFVMTVLLNGRMAMIISFSIFVYNLIILAKKRHVSSGTIRFVFIFLALVLTAGLVRMASTSQRISHLLSAFSPESDSYLGRTESYALAFNEYFNVYGVREKLFGSEYELIRLKDGREMAAESDVLGMLLEIGLLGFLYVFLNWVLAFKKTNEKLFEQNHISYRYALICMLVCMIQYRYASGNIRGILFWFIIMNSFIENKKVILCKNVK